MRNIDKDCREKDRSEATCWSFQRQEQPPGSTHDIVEGFHAHNRHLNWQYSAQRKTSHTQLQSSPSYRKPPHASHPTSQMLCILCPLASTAHSYLCRSLTGSSPGYAISQLCLFNSLISPTISSSSGSATGISTLGTANLSSQISATLLSAIAREMCRSFLRRLVSASMESEVLRQYSCF